MFFHFFSQRVLFVNDLYIIASAEKARVNLIFLARLHYLCEKLRRYAALVAKNIQVNLIFLTRLHYLCEQ